MMMIRGSKGAWMKESLSYAFLAETLVRFGGGRLAVGPRLELGGEVGGLW